MVAALGVWLLRAREAKAWANGEIIAWTIERPEPRHFWGSVLFGTGWSLAATCPGPVAVMIGEGRLGGLWVAAGIFAAVALQLSWQRAGRPGSRPPLKEIAGLAGLSTSRCDPRIVQPKVRSPSRRSGGRTPDQGVPLEG